MSIFFVYFPAAIVGGIIELTAHRLMKPKIKRGGDVTKFCYKR